jgi:hypothetical protein
MTKCCGKDRDTMFCSECGSQLREGSTLLKLLAHCRVNARRQKTESEEQGLHHRLKASSLRSWSKWRTWADELEKLLDTPDAEG